MKKLVFLLICVLLTLVCAAALADVKINATNFPDSNFRQYVKEELANGNSVMTDAEAAAVTEISCYEKGIKTLKGIELFPNLVKLNAETNELTELDLSGNLKLKEVHVMQNYSLASINVKKNTRLEILDVYSCGLTSLDVTRNTKLKELDCPMNQLTSINLSRNTALETFACYWSGCLASIDLSHNTNLKYLYLANEPLTSLDLSKNTKLEILWIAGTSLTSIDLSHNPYLKELLCESIGLTKLSLSKNTKLSKLRCYENNFTSLDVSRCSALAALVSGERKKAEGIYAYGPFDLFGPQDGNYLWVDPTVKVTAGSVVSMPTVKTSIAGATVEVEDQVYTGRKIKPDVTVTLNGLKLKKDTDYTVAYTNNKEIGKATVTVTGTGAYKGRVTAKFKIMPKPVKFASLAAGKTKLTVRWKKGSGITGYELEYSLKKDFSKSKTVVIKKGATVSTVIRNLKEGQTYYLRIRTYKTVGGKKYYSEWSDVMKQRMKGTAANDGEEEDSEFRSPHN